MRLFVLLTSTAFLIGSEFARADAPKAEAAAKPFQASFGLLQTQHMVVDVKINGKGPYRLIFDTGAPINLLNNKVAKESGVLPKDFRPPLFAPFGSVGQFKIKTLEVGNVKSENLTTMVMDHPTVTAISNALGPIEGIVGFSFFARYKTTIDYQAKVMTFVPVKFDPPDMLQNVMKLVMGRNLSAKRVLAPAGQWGFNVHKEDGDSEAGVTVKDVLAGGAAAKGGLKAGDRLLTLDGRWTDTVNDCYAAAAQIPSGTPARVVVRRAGKEMELLVTAQPGL
jgi:hypothetical protein